MSDLSEFLRARLDEDAAEIGRDEYDSGTCDYLPGVHVNPRRARADVEAKRLIVVHHDGPCCLKAPGQLYDSRTDPCLTLRYLAAVYAEHPDYRQEWKP